jgi:hypothetical protein
MIWREALGIVVVEALFYKSEGRGFETGWGKWIFFFFFIYPILPAAVGPEVCSDSNRHEYQKQKNHVSGEYSTIPPSVSRLSRQCGIFNISQPYRPPQPAKGIALLFAFFFLFSCSWWRISSVAGRAGVLWTQIGSSVAIVVAHLLSLQVYLEEDSRQRFHCCRCLLTGVARCCIFIE